MNNYNLDRFGLSLGQIQALVAEGLKSGGDWCDIYLEDTSYHNLLLRDGEVNSGGSHIDFGCGIRVLKGEKTGYAYAETTDFASLLSTAQSAGAIALSSSKSPAALKFSLETKQKTEPNFYPTSSDWRDSQASAFVPLLERLERSIRSKDQRVVKVIIMLSYSVSEIVMYNCLGQLCCDSRPLGSLTAQVILQQNGQIESRTASKSLRMGPEMLSDALLEELADKALEGVDESFEAKRPKGGQMPVVMAAGASGILLHEAMGHAFEADFNRKGQSIFSDKMGQKVCRKGINIVDDGTLIGMRGSCNYDDEGIPGQKTYMVQDGVLNSYLHDRISAAFYGVAPTGNGRRESFRYNPIPRMRSTYMENGTDGKLEDLIASVKKGIFVNQFANGQVKIGEGDFTFFVKSGRLIENGRLTMPVKDINIIGNGPEALADIQAVANDLKVDEGTWTCGKEQSVSVSCGIPSVLVGNLTVGGE